MTRLKAMEATNLPSVVEDDVEFVKDGVLVDDQAFGAQQPMPKPFRHPIRFIGWLIRVTFGIASLILVLAFVAAVPIVNFIALGYLLDVEGRVARTGKIRTAFPLLPFAPRIGSIVLGIGGWLFVVRLIADRLAVATQINPEAPGRQGLKFIICAAIAGHLCLALARGGTIGCFLRPIKNVLWFRKRRRAGDYWQSANDHIAMFVKGMRLKHHFWLGLRGFAGAFVWLVIPTALLAVANRPEGAEVAVTILGGICLIVAFAWVPFLQARFAAEQRFSAMFELRTIRELYRYASWSWLLAIVLTYLLAFPLFLAKVELPPNDLIWLITLIFVVSVYLTKVVTGWAYHRALRKRAEAIALGKSRPRFAPLLGSGLMIPVLGLYVFAVFFSQAFGLHGKLTLFEHHAFLLPAPFLLSGS